MYVKVFLQIEKFVDGSEEFFGHAIIDSAADGFPLRDAVLSTINVLERHLGWLQTDHPQATREVAAAGKLLHALKQLAQLSTPPRLPLSLP